MTLDQLLAAAVAPRAITATVNGIAYTWPAGEWDVIPDGPDSRIVRLVDGRDSETVLYLAEIDHLETPPAR